MDLINRKRPNPTVQTGLDYSKGYVPHEYDYRSGAWDSPTGSGIPGNPQQHGTYGGEPYYEQSKRVKLSHNEYDAYGQGHLPSDNSRYGHQHPLPPPPPPPPPPHHHHHHHPSYAAPETQRPYSTPYTQSYAPTYPQSYAPSSRKYSPPLRVHTSSSQYGTNEPLNTKPSNGHPVHHDNFPPIAHPQNVIPSPVTHSEHYTHKPSLSLVKTESSPYNSPRTDNLQYQPRSPNYGHTQYRHFDRSILPKLQGQDIQGMALSAAHSLQQSGTSENFDYRKQSSGKSSPSQHAQSAMVHIDSQRSSNIPYPSSLGNPPSPPRSNGQPSPHRRSPLSSSGSIHPMLYQTSPIRRTGSQSFSLPSLQLPPLNNSQNPSPSTSSFASKYNILPGPPNPLDPPPQQAVPQYSAV